MRNLAVFSAILFVGAIAPALVVAQDAVYGAESSSFRRLPTGLDVVKAKDAAEASGSENTASFGAVDESLYLVGPGDQFQIVYGGQSLIETVNSQGDLVVAAVPPIPVTGETLLKARAVIREYVSKQYKGDRVYVTLYKAKNFQVSLTGEFVKPGFHIMFSGAHVSDALESAKGFAYLASRTLVLTSSTGQKREIDLTGYFKNGDLEQNPILNQGDQIFAPAVDYSSRIVQVRDSQSVRAMPIGSDENLETLLHRFNNFNAAKEWQFVRVFRDGALKEIVNRKDGSKYKPTPGDLLEIHSPLTKVFVGGTVIQPGEIQYDPRLNLADYIARSGVTINTSTSYDKAIIVSAEGKMRRPRSPIEPILPGDHIWVPRSTEAKTRDYLVLITGVSSLAVAIATLFVLTGQ